MHYYKRNIGDYHKKAGRLTMLQHGAYALLLDSCYDRERFPTLEEAKDWLWASTPEEEAAVEFVLKKFFDLEGDVYIQNRIQCDLDQYHKNSATNKRIAIEREAKRKGKSTKREPTVNEPPPNHKPITNNHKPITNNQLKDLSADESTDVFDYWLKVMGKNNQSKFNTKRKAAVKSRFKEGYTVEQIKQAIDGCANTPHNMGQNDRGELYNDLELICRNGSNVERFAGNLSRVIPNQPDYSSVVEQVTLMQEQTQANQPLLIEEDF